MQLFKRLLLSVVVVGVSCATACDTVQLQCTKATPNLSVILLDEGDGEREVSTPKLVAVCKDGVWAVSTSSL